MDGIIGIVIIIVVLAVIIYCAVTKTTNTSTSKTYAEHQMSEQEKRLAGLKAQEEEIERSSMLRVEKIRAIHRLYHGFRSCPLCGDSDWNSVSALCATCSVDYEQDIEDGVIPDGLTRHNYDLKTWIDFRLLEREVRAGRMTRQAALDEEQILIARIQQSASQQTSQQAEKARQAKEAARRRRAQYLS